MDFTDILKIHEYEPKEVRLARHATFSKDVNNYKVTPYTLWRNSKDAYDQYCHIQRSKNFGRQKYVAHFVPSHSGETIFTGFFHLVNKKSTWEGLTCPLTGGNLHGMSHNNDPVIVYEVSHIKEFIPYEGKLIIEWGKATRKWSQIAGNTPKLVIALKQEISEPPFPGFGNFLCRSDKVSSLPESWKPALSSSKGIYILVHLESGDQYIGSATGEGGFFRRWKNYEATGDGGNKLLRPLRKKIFQIGILEVCSSFETTEDVLQKETKWKEKLGSKTFGLNLN